MKPANPTGPFDWRDVFITLVGRWMVLDIDKMENLVEYISGIFPVEIATELGDHVFSRMEQVREEMDAFVKAEGNFSGGKFSEMNMAEVEVVIEKLVKKILDKPIKES